MEMKENGRESNFNPIIEHELGQENVNNIEKFGKTIKTLVIEKGIEAHLLLVGGNVKPEKRGLEHKDVDLVLYSPQLAPTFFSGNNDPGFEPFSDFISEASERLGWEKKVEEPWFLEYSLSEDGKVVLKPTSGKPIEVLAIRKDNLCGSFEEHLSKQRDPCVVLF